MVGISIYVHAYANTIDNVEKEAQAYSYGDTENGFSSDVLPQFITCEEFINA